MFALLCKAEDANFRSTPFQLPLFTSSKDNASNRVCKIHGCCQHQQSPVLGGVFLLHFPALESMGTPTPSEDAMELSLGEVTVDKDAFSPL